MRFSHSRRLTFHFFSFARSLASLIRARYIALILYILTKNVDLAAILVKLKLCYAGFFIVPAYFVDETPCGCSFANTIRYLPNSGVDGLGMNRYTSPKTARQTLQHFSKNIIQVVFESKMQKPLNSY